MRYTVVLTADFPDVARNILAPHFDVIEHPTEHGRSEDDLIMLLADADGAITLLQDPITRRVLEANPNLRIVSNHAVGYNNIDIDAAGELGIAVTNTPGVLTEATADLTMALMLAVVRRIVEGDAEIRASGRCEWEPLKLLGASLQGKTLGIIGMGRIGSAVATRARAFGMDIIGVRRGESLDELLATSDVVSIHAPLSRETHHLIDAAGAGEEGRRDPAAHRVGDRGGKDCDGADRGDERAALFERAGAVAPHCLSLRRVSAGGSAVTPAGCGLTYGVYWATSCRCNR